MRNYLVILFVLLSTTLFAQTAQKIGYVDSQIIFNQYPAAIKAQSDLEALGSVWNNQIDSMTIAYQQMITDYRKQEATMTNEQKLARQQEIVAFEQNVLDFRNKKFGQPNGEFYLKRDEILKPVNEKILAAIEQVAKSEVIHFVFDKSGDIVLLYADAAFDITFKVLDNLKRGK